MKRRSRDRRDDEQTSRAGLLARVAIIGRSCGWRNPPEPRASQIETSGTLIRSETGGDRSQAKFVQPMIDNTIAPAYRACDFGRTFAVKACILMRPFSTTKTSFASS